MAFCPLSLAALGDEGDLIKDCCAAVGGPSSSLQAETAVLYLLLLETPPSLRLTVLMDSLGLLQTLQRWGRLDFSPRPEIQKHYDIIFQILELLAESTATTTLVKVKSHSGVPLNEAANVLADAGTESLEILCEPDRAGTRLHAFTASGDPVPNLNTFLKEGRHSSLRAAICAKDGFLSKGYLAPLRGHRFLEKAKRKIKSFEKRRLLQALGGVYPSNHWRCRIGIITCPNCPLCGSVDHSPTASSHVEPWLML